MILFKISPELMVLTVLVLLPVEAFAKAEAFDSAKKITG